MDELKARIKELAKVAAETQKANSEAHEKAARALVNSVLDLIEPQARNGAMFGEFRFSEFPQFDYLKATSETVTKRAEALAENFGLILGVHTSISLLAWSFAAETSNVD